MDPTSESTIGNIASQVSQKQNIIKNNIYTNNILYINYT